MPPRHKYNARSTKINGIQFDSLAEADHYLRLSNDPTVENLRTHGDPATKFVLVPAFERDGMKFPAVTYEADFVYQKDNQTFVIDVKGMILPEFKIKWKLFRFFYPQFTALLVDKRGKPIDLYKRRVKPAA